MKLNNRTQRTWIKIAAIVSAVNVLVSPVASLAATRNWDGDTSTAWGTAANWDTAPVNDLTSDTANFNLASYGGSVYAPNAGTVSIGGITIGGATPGNAAMTLSGSNLSIGASGITIASGAGALTLSPTTVTLGNAQTWTNNDNDAMAINAALDRTTSKATLNLAGTGPFTSSTLVNSGSTGIIGPWLTIGTGTSAKYATISGGAISGLTGTSAATAAALTDTTGAVNYELAAGGTAPLNASANTIRYTGAAATLTPNATSGLTLNGLMNVGSGLLTIGTNPLTIGANKELVITGPSDITISSKIQDNAGGASSLTYSGTGTLMLTSSANSFTGGLTLNSGVLMPDPTVDNVYPYIGTGALTLAGGRFQFKKVASVNFTNNVIVSGSATIRCTNSSGQNPSFTGNWTISPGAGTLTFDSGSAVTHTSTISNPVTVNADLTLVATSSAGAVHNVTLTGGIVGGGALVNAGTGTLTLGGSNYLTGGITINAGTVADGGTAAVSAVAMGNNAISIGASAVLDLTAVIGDNYIREFSGSGQIKANYQSDVIVNSLNDTTFSGTDLVSGNPWGMAKTGPGTLTFTGDTIQLNSRTGAVSAQFWRGGVTFSGTLGALSYADTNPHINIYEATVTIDESAADLADRVNDAMSVKALGGGGTFTYKGLASGSSAETVGALSMGGRAPTVNVAVNPGGGNATLTFASYGNDVSTFHASIGGAVNFTSTGTLGTSAFVKFGTTTPTLYNNVMAGAFVNGTDIATYDTTSGVLPFQPTSYGGSLPKYVAAASATDTGVAYANANVTLDGNTTWTALKIDGGQTINLNGNELTLGKAGTSATGMGQAMVVKVGSGNAVIQGTTAAKYLRVPLAGASAGEYQNTHYAFMVNEGTLKVTAPLLGGSLALHVSKMGSGVLWLDPAVAWGSTTSYGSYGSGIHFGEGVVRLDPRNSNFGNETMVLNGGVMEITGGITYSPTIGTGNANLMWQTSGGFAAYGADAIVSPNITWNATSHIPDGAALLLNSATADKKITLSGTLNLGTDAAKMYLREINVVSGAHANAVAEISGQIISDTTAGGGGTATDTYHLVKTGTGTLILSNSNNNYSGATYVKEGTLLVNGTLATPASSNAALNPDYSAVTVMSGATLAGTGTILRPVTVQSGGTIGAATSTSTLVIGSVATNADLTLSPGGMVSTPVAASSVAGLVNVTGNFSYTSSPATKYTLKLTGSGDTGSTYKFLQWSGSGPSAGNVTADWLIDGSAVVGFGTTDTNWTKPGTGDWDTASNWDGIKVSGTIQVNASKWLEVTDLGTAASVPLAHQNVYIRPAGASPVVTGPAAPGATVKTLTIGKDDSSTDTAELQLQSGGPLTVTGLTTVTKLGKLSVKENMTTGGLSITGGNGTTGLVVIDSGKNLTSTGAISVAAGGTLTATAAALTAASLTSSGAVSVGTGTSISGTATINNGTFNASAGTLGTLTVNGGTVGGTALAATITTANFLGGTSTVTGGAISGTTTLNATSGSLTLSGGTIASLVIPSTDTVNPTIGSGATITSATIDGSGLGGATVTLGNTAAMTSLTVNGATTVVSHAAGAVGTVALNNGSLSMGGNITTLATLTGTSSFTYTGTSITSLTIPTTATSVTLPSWPTSANVTAADIDASKIGGSAITFAGSTPMTSLTVRGGTVTRTGDVNSSPGTVSVTGGLLNLTGSATTATVTGGGITTTGGTIGTFNHNTGAGISTIGSGTTITTAANIASGTVNFNSTQANGTLTVTGGATTIGPAVNGNLVKVATADFSAGTGTVNAANPLAITSTLKLSGGITGTYTPGSGPAYFTASNPASGDIVADTNRTLTLSGGKLQLAKQSGTDVITTFTYTGSSASFIVPTSLTAKVLVVAGGGGGGKGEGGAQGDGAGGGGAGGLIYNGTKYFSDGTYSIYVGNGGAGSTSNSARGANGEDSYIQLGGIDVFRAIGGGGGGSDNYDAINQGADGGSGGGAASSHNQTWSGGSRRVDQGNAGGSTSYTSGMWGPRGGAGGGGAGLAGTSEAAGDPEWRGKAGGNGLTYSISGGDVPYAGGGGGGNCRDNNGTPGGAGGSGGGGAGGAAAANGGNGTDNTGGGGGGGGGGGTGGKGGSGIVIVSYAGSAAVNLPNTHIAATAGSTPTLDLGASDKNHTLGNVTVTAGAGANTTLTVNNVNTLTIGTLTIGINGAYYGKLDLGTKTLTLNGVTKLAVTTVSSTVTTAITVAVAKTGSFAVLDGTEVTDNNSKKWTVTVVDMGGGEDGLRLNPPASGTLILFK